MIGIFITTRDEADLLQDWIPHYLSYGADHIVIADNKSKDHTQDVIRSFGNSVTSVVYSDFNNRDKVMTKCLHNFVERYGTPDWVALLDTDEFIWSPRGNLVDLLAEVPKDYPAVTFKQKLFTVTAYDREEGPVFSRHLWRILPESPLFFSYRRGKTFFRGAGFEHFTGGHVHPAITRYWRPEEPIIHHYAIRSEEHFIQKVVYLYDERPKFGLGKYYWVDQLRQFLRLRPIRPSRNDLKLRWFDILHEEGVEGLHRYYRNEVLFSREKVDQLAARGELVRDAQFADWMEKRYSSRDE